MANNALVFVFFILIPLSLSITLHKIPKKNTGKALPLGDKNTFLV
ncbi:hypothetical protein CLOSYM_00187 [[Clostridium] symbiosum ATCC 14940]|uniref:Uncharacterized protein n=1 Tax=[Clostridium] symbiosum ATCC 14940 TaxID=411472 RepID=A0ABC9U3P5_CLOSY|nr:hypothetical protein CLOSYM_00187 [[Clostridium] symbiosum ATCC 14940]